MKFYFIESYTVMILIHLEPEKDTLRLIRVPLRYLNYILDGLLGDSLHDNRFI